MNRSTRNFFSVALIAVLLAAVAPAAQAFPLGQVRLIQPAGGDWLDEALTWLGRLFGTEPAAAATQEKATTTTNRPAPPPTSQGTGGPFNGSCIDPNGCSTGGSGGI